jgi:DNA-directed RNA polymerase specialized sigma24 family protein
MDFGEFVAARRTALVRSAVLLGCSLEDAEDVVQTTLTRTLRHWRRVSRADRPDAYVYRVLVNALRDARNRRWNAEIPTVEPPETSVRETDLLTGLVVLRFYADLSERETAEALGVPAGTVKSRTARALAALAADRNIVRSG